MEPVTLTGTLGAQDDLGLPNFNFFVSTTMTTSHIEFIRLPEVARRLGVGRSTVYKLIAHGHFPHGVKITSKLIAWPAHVVEAWSAERIASQSQK